MAEIMFEEFKVPAFYIANSAVLSSYGFLPDQRLFHMNFFSFAAGKGTALLIDIGKDTASVIPVVDGFVLRKGTTH